MATLTTTITLSSPYAEKIRELTLIAREHQYETDELSQELLDFATAILISARENCRAPLETQRRVADAHIQLLARKVLKCPLFVQNFLVRPFLASDGCVWSEPEYFLCYQRCDGISPFDGNPMDINPMPHLFARKMLVLADLSPRIEERKEGDATVHIDQQPPLDPMLKAAWKSVYQQLATLAGERMRSQRQQRNARASSRYMEHAVVQRRQSGVVLSREAAERDLAFREETVQNMQLMQRAYDGEIGALRSQREEAEIAHRAKVALLQEQITANREQAGVVEAQINEMNGAHQRQIAALGAQISSLEIKHRELERRREEEARESEARIIQMADRQKREAEADWKRVQSLGEQTRALNEKNEVMEVEMGRVRRNLNWAMQELADIDTGCALM